MKKLNALLFTLLAFFSFNSFSNNSESAFLENAFTEDCSKYEELTLESFHNDLERKKKELSAEQIEYFSLGDVESWKESFVSSSEDFYISDLLTAKLIKAISDDSKSCLIQIVKNSQIDLNSNPSFLTLDSGSVSDTTGSSINDMASFLAGAISVILGFFIPDTFLEVAVVFNSKQSLKALIQLGADVNDPGLGWSSLGWAALFGNYKMVEMLIQEGAEVNPSLNESPLMLAVLASEPLVPSPENPSEKEPRATKDFTEIEAIKRMNGFFAFLLGNKEFKPSNSDYVKTVKTLITNGADVTQAIGGETALSVAKEVQASQEIIDTLEKEMQK